MKLLQKSPNFSVVIPGCSQRCAFCFENKKLEAADESHRLSLEDVLVALPPVFRAVSITGGEPLEHPDKLRQTINTILPHVRSGKIERIVITTNGTDLSELLSISKRYKKYPLCFNVSRHAVDDEQNQKIFGGLKKVATASELWKFTTKSHHPVSINCVLPRENCPTSNVLEHFIGFMNGMDIERICFRIEHGDLSKHQIEDSIARFIGSNARMYEDSCPVCASRTYVSQAGGMDTPVTFKYSCTKPLEELGGAYELIYHPNHTVSPNWDGSNPLTVKEMAKMCGAPKPRKAVRREPKVTQESDYLKDLRKALREIEKLKEKIEESIEEAEEMEGIGTQSNRWTRGLRARPYDSCAGGTGGC